MIGDGQRIAVAAVAELELALEVGAPQIVRLRARRQRRSSGALPWSGHALARPCRSRTAWIVLLAGTRTSPSSRRTRSSRILRAPQCGFSVELDNQGLDLSRQLIGIAYRAFGAVVQRLKPVFLVAIKDLVVGLPRNAEIPAYVRHCLPVQQPGDKPQALLHHRTRFPRHQHLPPTKGEKCYPCVRYEVSPMSRAAQPHPPNLRYLIRSICMR